jgi:folylpolyglutamate synthase/dihydropteroate synthase
MRDKDADGMLAALAPVVGSIIITRVANARAADPAELLSRLAAIAPRLTASVSATPAEAVTDGWKESRRIVVAGSIFLLGDVMKAFGWT